MTRRHAASLLGIVASAALVGGCVHDPAAGVVLPVAIQVPDTEVLAIAARGAGFQIYECRASSTDPKVFAWTLKAPDATLHYQAGRSLGRHYAGPTWEANDGSKVVGEVIAHADAPDPKAIPWLLLRAKSNAGNGVFAHVQSIQRLHTVGGKAPTTGCDRRYAGSETRVAYSADYYFYVPRP